MNMQYDLVLDCFVCENGWLGYGGNRYLLYTNYALNFSDARELCVLNNFTYAR